MQYRCVLLMIAIIVAWVLRETSTILLGLQYNIEKWAPLTIPTLVRLCGSHTEPTGINPTTLHLRAYHAQTRFPKWVEDGLL